MHSKKIQNVLSLPPQERYNYLIRKLADFEEVWLIRNENDLIQMVNLYDKNESVPVWPERGFAELVLKDDWKHIKVESMDLYEFMDWLVTLGLKGIKIAAFPLPDLSSIEVHPLEMKKHLELECRQYE